jgi:hypothetical protein
MPGDSSFGQSDRRAQHPGNLGVVATAVGCPGERVGQGMLRGSQAVELADESEPRARCSAGELSLDAGQSQSGARAQPQCAHPLGDQRGGPHFVKAGFRMAQDGLAEIDDGLGVAIDRIADRALQLVFAAHEGALLRRFVIVLRLDPVLAGAIKKGQPVWKANPSAQPLSF